MKQLILLSVLLLGFFTNHFISCEIMRWWEHPLTVFSDTTEHYDVGIVLGGGMVTIDAKNDRKTFRNNLDRILQTLDLYHSKRIDKILISGGAGSLIYTDMLEAALLKDYIISIGVLPQDVLIDSLSDNTYENAVNTAAIISENPMGGKYLLITSSSHMRRAKACFEKVGLVVTPYSTSKITGERRYHIDHLLLPSVESLVVWNKFFHEFVGYAVYNIKGYI